MKTTFNDMRKPNCERRDFTTSGLYSQFGRSSFTITCPFCSDRFTVYVWSFAGCGKRCECGAIFSSLGAYKLQPVGKELAGKVQMDPDMPGRHDPDMCGCAECKNARPLKQRGGCF